MSRIDRLKDYAAMKGPRGAGRDQSNIDYWSRRATANSDGDKHRASSGEMKLPDTGATKLRDTSAKPYNARHVNKRMVAKQDTNFVGGSDYMRGIRRDA